MNIFIGSGRLTRNAIINGDKTKALKFTIAAKYGYNSKEKTDRVEFVPCVLFNPSKGQEQLLMNEGKGIFVEFKGRISTTSYEVDGETRFSTAVIVDKSTFSIITK